MEREDRSRLPFREQTTYVKITIVVMSAVGLVGVGCVLAVAGRLVWSLVRQVFAWVF